MSPKQAWFHVLIVFWVTSVRCSHGCLTIATGAVPCAICPFAFLLDNVLLVDDPVRVAGRALCQHKMENEHGGRITEDFDAPAIALRL
jgi:hypothetical protein